MCVLKNYCVYMSACYVCRAKQNHLKKCKYLKKKVFQINFAKILELAKKNSYIKSKI